ncbi:MAG: hypothetical protein KGL39_43505 [Patescibacteria group bacterium]|nr:hypothetical protein [Patescibacteria group bacterium]
MPTAATPRPERYQAEDDNEFVVFHDVPTFAEHVADDGTVYDKQKLAWICDNQNRRIDDTGDFTPVVIQHTSDNDEPKNDPQVIGFAGPFHLGKIGKQKPRWAILGTYRIFKEDEKAFRRHPRRSVELWVEDDPRDRFFDPIACLGSETPRLDLSLVYSRRSPNKLIARYQGAPVGQATPSASFPSGTNTFVPSLGTKKKKHDKEPSDVALSPDDVKQIVEALQNTSEFQFVRELMKQAGGAEGDDDSDGAGGSDAGEPSADLPQTEPEDKNEAKRAVELMKKYGADHEEAKAAFDALDDDGKRKCMQYALDADGDDKVEPDDEQRQAEEEARRKEEEAVNPEASKMNYAKAIEQVRKNSVPLEKFAKLERDHSDLKSNYSKLQKRVEDAEAAATKEKRVAVRYKKLRDLEAEGYQLDPAEEIKDCEDLTDEQFDKHVAKIHKNYQRMESQALSQVAAISRPTSMVEQVKNQKAEEDRVERIKKYAMNETKKRGKHVGWDEAKAAIEAEDAAKATAA